MSYSLADAYQPGRGAAWHQRHSAIISGNSDTESASGGSSRSRESSPSASPHDILRHKIATALDEYGEPTAPDSKEAFRLATIGGLSGEHS
jgi:hypothetical protein